MPLCTNPLPRRFAATIAMTALALAPLTTASAVQLCGNSNGSNQTVNAGNGYTATAWLNAPTNGWACLWSAQNGDFSVYWDITTYGFVHRVSKTNLSYRFDNCGNGWAWGSHTLNEWGNTGGVLTGLYGWAGSPTIEWYIIENWFGPKQNYGSFLTYKGSITVDGGTYDIYHTPKVSWGDFGQWWSVRQTGHTSGTVSYGAHFAKWRQLGAANSIMQEASWFVEPSQWPTKGKVTYNSVISLP